MNYGAYTRVTASLQSWKGGFKSVNAAIRWLDMRRTCGQPEIKAAVFEYSTGLVVWERGE
jgi:hypothetical protein